ncbi:MAG: hypothetical protein Q7T72_09275 [Bacteroidales bacterium]|nr:hypothetical protein [Bacteroidales bacterium]MDP3003364.1 hypothetical protein [Bacteroidales bacterium]
MINLLLQNNINLFAVKKFRISSNIAWYGITKYLENQFINLIIKRENRYD